MKRKILSIILAVAMLLNTSVIPVFAAEDPASSGLDSGIAIGTSGLCDHHTTHDGDCDYIEGEEGAVCTLDCSECAAQDNNDPDACTCEAGEGEAHAEGCPTYETSEEPECSCGTEDETHSGDCPLYTAPVEPEAPECACTGLCAEGAVNTECSVCSAESADLTVCIGEAAPACACTGLCAEDAVNAECPVCSAEGADLTACMGAAIKIITGWSWIETKGFEEMIDIENILPLVGVSESNPIDVETLLTVLPKEITATIDGAEETIVLSGWSCAGFPAEGADSGSYAFTASLPDGYALADDAPALTVTVELGGAAVYADSKKYGLTVSDGTEGVDYKWGESARTSSGEISTYTYSVLYSVLSILTDTSLTISGTGWTPSDFSTSDDYGDVIYIPQGVTANVALKDAHITGGSYTAPITVDGTLNLTLEGSNTLTLPNFTSTSTNMPGIWC